MGKLTEIIITATTQQFDRGIDRVTTGFRNAGQAGQSLNAGLSSLTNTVSAMAGAFAVVEVGKFALDASLAADNVATMRTSMVSLSGGAGAAVKNMEALDRATMGIASESEKLAIGQQFLGMQLVDNAADLERVITASTRLGGTFQNLGAKEAADQFALMIANTSDARLDSFGLNSGRVRERINELMETTAGMTREMAFFQATMEEAEVSMQRLGPASLSTTQHVQAAASAFDEMKIAIGELVNATGIIDTLAADAKQLFDEINAGVTAWQGVIANINKIETLEAQNELQSLNDAVQSVLSDDVDMSALENGLSAAVANTGEFNAALVGVTGSYDEYLARIDRFAQINPIAASTLVITQQEFNQLSTDALEAAAAIEEVVRANASLSQSQAIANQFAAAADEAQSLADQQRINEDAAKFRVRQLRIEQNQLNTQRKKEAEELAATEAAAAERAQSEAARSAEKYARDAASAYEREFSAVQSTVSSVIGAAQNVLGDLKLDFLQDDGGRGIGEDARRLAAIAAGDFNGEAAKLLEQSNPELFRRVMESENPQEIAQNILRDFQAGIGVGDVIDRDAAKERIKRILLGQSDTQALVNEITQELIGEGFSQQQIQSAMGAAGLGLAQPAIPDAVAQGLQPMDTASLATGTAQGLMETLPDALADAGVGTLFMKSLRDQIADQEEISEQIATVFVSGFNNFLPSQLGLSAQLFLETIATYVAQQLGVAVTARQ